MHGNVTSHDEVKVQLPAAIHFNFYFLYKHWVLRGYLGQPYNDLVHLSHPLVVTSLIV